MCLRRFGGSVGQYCLASCINSKLALIVSTGSCCICKHVLQTATAGYNLSFYLFASVYDTQAMRAQTSVKSRIIAPIFNTKPPSQQPYSKPTANRLLRDQRIGRRIGKLTTCFYIFCSCYCYINIRPMALGIKP